MRRQSVNGLLWLLGACVVVALVTFVGWRQIYEACLRLGPGYALVWCAMTVATRLLLTEALTRPIAVLGGNFRLSDAFWLGWLRSFFNQIVPLGGTAYLAHHLRARTSLSWTQMVALASPQVLFLGIAIGLIGCALVLISADLDNYIYWMLLALFAIVGSVCLVLVTGSNRISVLVPASLYKRIDPAAKALDAFHSRYGLIAWIVAIHSSAIVLRGMRLWVVFTAIGIPIDLHTVMLLSCVGELSLVIQMTPGGLGVREGTLVGAAVLLGVDVKSATSVAILDRLLTVALVSLFAPVAFWCLRRSSERGNVRSP